MLRLTNLSNKYLRRTLRVLYGQTQAYPYDAQLDPLFDRTAGALSGGVAITGAKAAILPGLVAGKGVGESVAPSYTGGSSTNRPFGLFANFVGGEMSDFPSDFDRVGVWRGVGSVYEILAPAFSDANTLSSLAAADNDDPVGDGGFVAAEEVYMNPNAKGQLEAADADAYELTDTARLIQRLSANAVIVELLV